ncbi:MAG: hypothetical protein M1814_002992 [Vezdaea aestivalis]|nr:MAG: hypothetical protein M1814_002992 [Vezdaea aestivalis]
MDDYRQASSDSPAGGTPVSGPNGQKRKNEDGPTGSRAKRNRYISIACLQEQVNTLYSDVHTWRQGSATAELAPHHPKPASFSTTQSTVGTPDSPSRNRFGSRPKPPNFRGPTSSTYNINLAKSSLHTMGISAPEEPIEDEATPLTSPVVVHPDKDPLWSIGREEAVRLVKVYEDEVSSMHPVAKMDDVFRHLSMLFTFMEAAIKNQLFQPGDGGQDLLVNDSACIVKMVLAIALVLEGTGESQQGQELFETVRSVAEQRLWSSEVDFSGILILTLIAIYFFQCDDETQAWRFIGVVARMCIQLGLHRHDYQVASFAEGPEREHANVFFWSIFVLDRRWSYGTGMPFAIQEGDIDPDLPEPDQPLYLKAMIGYSHVGSKLWTSTSQFDPSSSIIDLKEIEYQDYQIQTWRNSLPASLQFLPSPSPNSTTDRQTHRLRVLLYLRANATRIAIYRRVLHSATTISSHLAHAETVVAVAKDTIRVLTHLAQHSDIYHRQQILFNYFCAGALAVLFLAVAHAPATFSAPARDEFYMALDLVHGFHARSYVSQRLWRTIRGLRDIGPKLGLALHQEPSTQQQQNESSVAAAAAMADLAAARNTHPPQAFPPLPPPHQQQHQPQQQQPANGSFALSSELTSLFEAAGGFLAQTDPQTGQMGPHPAEGLNGGFAGQSMVHADGNTALGAETYAGEEELNRIMRELF